MGREPAPCAVACFERAVRYVIAASEGEHAIDFPARKVFDAA